MGTVCRLGVQEKKPITAVWIGGNEEKDKKKKNWNWVIWVNFFQMGSNFSFFFYWVAKKKNSKLDYPKKKRVLFESFAFFQFSGVFSIPARATTFFAVFKVFSSLFGSFQIWELF